ncbi:MAG: hypothetical protein CBD58_00435 [bacterium TMED198]|nr:MAG: hypothetical protein CBD58_00435 [bacterium TMED198]
MDDLLKEAIADAKAVRETALENAKMALEEAFTPRLQNMLSKKIQSEIDKDDEDMEERDMMDDEDENPMDDDMEERSMMKADDEDPSDEDSKDEGIIEIDGVKYAPVVSEEEDDEEDEMEEGEDKDDEDMEEDLDLESVIKELESELDEAEEVEEADEVEEGKEEVEEQSKSSGIGAGDNKVAQPSAGDEEDPGKGKLKEGEEVDEDVDLDEVLKALSEEEDEEEEKNEIAELKSNLKEHRSVIETLRGKLNEVNLLNAKLLFTNKLFRKYGLNNEQKMKVVEQFDRASNLREVKLVYSTLGESFGAARNEINESKGAASKPVASTKSEKEVITESSDLRDRFKKLANLI